MENCNKAVGRGFFGFLKKSTQVSVNNHHFTEGLSYLVTVVWQKLIPLPKKAKEETAVRRRSIVSTDGRAYSPSSVHKVPTEVDVIAVPPFQLETIFCVFHFYFAILFSHCRKYS